MPSFTDKIQELETPIDVMYLMHKVFMAHSEKTEALARSAQSGGDLGDLERHVYDWLKHLRYHVDTEDEYMTGPLLDTRLQGDRFPLKDNEREHREILDQGDAIIAFLEEGEIAGLADDIRMIMLKVEEQEHADYDIKVSDVEDALAKALGEERVLARTRRHLYRSIMALRVTEFDHFENEEAFVLPLVKEQMSRSQELQCVWKLLFDEDSNNSRWIIDFMYAELQNNEKRLLLSLEEEFESLDNR